MNTRFKKSIMTLAFLASGLVLSSAANAAASGLAIDSSRNLAFTAVTSGVVVLDVTSPSIPSLVSEAIQANSVVNDVFYQASKQLLYVVTDNSEMEIWDVQDASNPQRLSVIKGTYFGSESALNSVAVVGNIARATAIDFETTYTFDVSDPANPVATGFSKNSQTHEVELGNNGKLYRSAKSVLQMTLDANGDIISSTNNQYFRATQIAAEGNYIFGSSNNTLNVVSTGNGLPFVSQVSTGQNIYDIAVNNDIVYIASSNGLNLWDVSDKTAPYQIGTDNSGAITDVETSGDYAYVRNSSVDFKVLDISIASNPIVVGEFTADGSSGGTGGVSNVAPVANAGTTQGVTARTRGVTLDGSGSYDLDGSIVSYSWVQTSGKSVSLSGANTVMPTFRAPGTKRKIKHLEFQLTVTDDDGATGISSVDVAVYPK